MRIINKVRLVSYTAFLGAAVLSAALSGCSDNATTKALGGTTTINLACDQKLENITWKETNVWFLTRPMREAEKAETHTFKEKSTFGYFEGTVIINEFKCGVSTPNAT